MPRMGVFGTHSGRGRSCGWDNVFTDTSSHTFNSHGDRACQLLAEVGNVTSKCNGVTLYRLSHLLRAITLSSYNSWKLDRAITVPKYQEQ